MMTSATVAAGRRELGNRDALIYAAIGLGVWLNGALTFRLGGAFLFESGLAMSVAVAIFISLAVCFIFRSTMRWRGTKESEALTVAIIMLLPGLFGEAARQSVFGWATGLDASAAPRFSAIMFLGNAVLIAYALARTLRTRASAAQ
ncbi:MAG TPA: DUF5367 family protein [Rhizomicrobium sp.]|jgi:hypothetical protein|nr:DUF5367 family protein [Rhizomicrobium sp.]